MAKPYDICIRGTGIVGRTLALLLAKERLRVALVGAPLSANPSKVDVRAYALNAASRATLESLRCWPPDEQATGILNMCVSGDHGGSVQFSAMDQAVPALGWVTDVSALEARLAEAIRFQPAIEWLEEPVFAPLSAICEGRSSHTRQELGVDFAVSPYEQTAVATRVRCSQPHLQTARQWFSDKEILALLPLGGSKGRELAVVWSVAPERANELMALTDLAFAQQLERTAGDAFGTIEPLGPRSAWPLQLAMADRWCGRFEGSDRAWVLVGDAAHTVHPLSGQGLNLGIADAHTLAHAFSGRGAWQGVSDQRMLRRYARERRTDSLPMRAGTDFLAQLFAHQLPVFESLRNWGMQGFDRSGPLKRLAARLAINSTEPFARASAREEQAP